MRPEAFSKELASFHNIGGEHSYNVSLQDYANLSRRMFMFASSDSLKARVGPDATSILNTLLRRRILIRAPFFGKRQIYAYNEVARLLHVIKSPNHKFPEKPFVEQVYNKVVRDGPLRHSELIASVKEMEDSTEDEEIIETSIKEAINVLRNSLKVYFLSSGRDPLVSLFTQIKITGEKETRIALTLQQATYLLIKELFNSLKALTVRQITALLDIELDDVFAALRRLQEEEHIKKIEGDLSEYGLYSIIWSERKKKENKDISQVDIEQEKDLKWVKLLNSVSNSEPNATCYVIPDTDILARYWMSSSFPLNLENDDYLVLQNGIPVASFSGKKESQRHKKFIVTKIEYDAVNMNEEQIRKAIEDYFLLDKARVQLPLSLHEDNKEKVQQAYSILKERGFALTSNGARKFLHTAHKVQRKDELTIKPVDAISIYADRHHLSRKYKLDNIRSLFQYLHNSGVPPPGWALVNRFGKLSAREVQQYISSQELISIHFGIAGQGLIPANDYPLYYSALVNPRDEVLSQGDRVILHELENRPQTIKKLAKKIRADYTTLRKRVTRLKKICALRETNPLRTRWQPAILTSVPSELRKRLEIQDVARSTILKRSLETNFPSTLANISRIFGTSLEATQKSIRRLIGKGDIESIYFYPGAKRVQFTQENFRLEIKSRIKPALMRPNYKQLDLYHLYYDDPLFSYGFNTFVSPFKDKLKLLQPRDKIFGEVISTERGGVAALYSTIPDRPSTEHYVNVEIPAVGDLELLLQEIFRKVLFNKRKIYPKQSFTIKVDALNGKALTSNEVSHYKDILVDLDEAIVCN